jgi:hypothetical protein
MAVYAATHAQSMPQTIAAFVCFIHREMGQKHRHYQATRWQDRGAHGLPRRAIQHLKGGLALTCTRVRLHQRRHF